jgi:hypothetical protein
MKILVVLVVAGLAFWFVGSQIIGHGKVVRGVAEASKDNVNSVAGVLQQATENAQKQGSRDETTWQGKINALCSQTSSSLDTLGTPRSMDEIAVYLGGALPMVRSLHQRLGTFPPPAALADQASRAGPALLKQEDLLARVRAAARDGQSARMLDEIERLRSLARAENPNLIGMGLADCTLPSWGVPL